MNLNKKSKGIFLNCPRYLEENYLKIYPGKTPEDFYEYQDRQPLDLDIIRDKEAGCNIRYAGIRRVPIDEEYLKWLKENNSDVNKKSLNDYMESLTDREVRRLWIKNYKYNWFSMVSYLSIDLVTENRKEPTPLIKIPEKIQINVQQLFQNCLPINDKDVYVNPYILHHSVINETADIKLELIGSSYFTNNFKYYDIETSDMNFKKVHYHHYFLPVINKATSKSIITREELEERSKMIFRLTEEGVNKLEGTFKQTFPNYYKISLQPRIFAFDDIEKYVKHMYTPELM